MGKGGQTIGYHYLFSLLSGLGRGPIDELVEINVGGLTAWKGHICNGEVNVIDSPDLFGGDQKEGGIQGPFRVFMGEPDQILPGPISGTIVGSSGPVKGYTLPDVKASMGGLVSEMRGVVMVWFDGLVTSMNPYPKEWKFRVRRSKKGWYGGRAWYEAKATIFLSGVEEVTYKKSLTISEFLQSFFTDKGGSPTQSVKMQIPGNIHAMNGAHIIYECCTNPQWGRGLPASRLDDNSFTYAANRLCLEGFGLCITWYRKEDIDAFIQKICDHLGAVVYTDRETGKIVLRLIRDDYDPETVPLYTPDSGLLSIQNDDTASTDAQYNEVIVTGHDPIADLDIQARSHNIAARQAQGASSTLDQTYEGLPTVGLCGRIAQRDMRVSAAGLKKLVLTFDRRAWRIAPGSVIRISDPRRSIDNMIVRVGEIDDGKMTAGQIKIKVVQDVFGLPDTAFVTPVENDWTPPTTDPVPAADSRMFEIGFRDLYLKVGAATANAALPTDAYFGTLAAQPTVAALQYDLIAKADGEPAYLAGGTHSFTADALLVGALNATDTEFVIASPSGFSDDLVGDALRIDAEIMRIDDYDPATLTMTVARGAQDTWPATHETGARVWLPDDDAGTDQRLYGLGETVDAKVLTRTSRGVLAAADAAELTIVLQGRPAKPYPPADVTIGGTSVLGAVGVQDEPEFAWVERNRLTQADHLVGFFEATVTPEDATTYRARIYDADGVTLLNTYDAITSPWTYDTTMQGADGAGNIIFYELVAVRDTLESWSPRRLSVTLNGGYGLGYGLNYGGSA